MQSSRSLCGLWPAAFVSMTLLAQPGCTTASAPSSDGAFGADGGTRPDAVVVFPDGASMHPDGGGSDDATMMFDVGLVAVDAASSPDSALPASDGGHDAATFSGDAWTGVCGDGVIDPPETCDPGPSSGAGSVHHNPSACPVSGRSDLACQWCRHGLTPWGCLDGDYLEVISPPTTWATSCQPSPNNVLSWVVWHSAADRDAIIAAYRSAFTLSATRPASGWIGLHAASDTAPFLWEDDGSTLTAATLLPIHNGRSAGAQCMVLTVTDTDAYLTYALCSEAGRSALCFTQPWGTVR